VAAAVVVFLGLAAGSLASSLPQPGGGNSLSGVSCVSVEDRWAVGWTVDRASCEVVGEDPALERVEMARGLFSRCGGGTGQRELRVGVQGVVGL
jgi:hypothetical protein